MVIYSNCKINIGLNVVTKRKDGYHDIESMMYPVRGLCDVLEIVKSDKEGIELTLSGLELPCPLEENLVIKAYDAMRKKYPDQITGVKAHLHKNIPTGAGLGGASSNAGAMIKGLNELFELNMRTVKMERVAASLGSDAAFFINNIPTFAAGRGELLYPANVSMAGYKLVIIKPKDYVSTAEAYKIVKTNQPTSPLSKAVRHPVEMWRSLVENRFERFIFPKFPAIERAKKILYQRGAVYASMSGSGSAVYGIFTPDTEIHLDDIDMFVYQEDMV